MKHVPFLSNKQDEKEPLEEEHHLFPRIQVEEEEVLDPLYPEVEVDPEEVGDHLSLQSIMEADQEGVVDLLYLKLEVVQGVEEDLQLLVEVVPQRWGQEQLIN